MLDTMSKQKLIRGRAPVARGVPGMLVSGLGLSLDLIDSDDGAREASERQYILLDIR
jgi:hypothetical protein